MFKPNVRVPEPVMQIIAKLHDAKFKAYLAGGCIRDILLDRIPKDYDIATSATPYEVSKLFPKIIPTGIAHGTITVIEDNYPVEVTTFRSEGEYTDSRRPSSVTFEEDIEDDLSRRDLTINSMAWDPFTDKIIDPFEGQIDLQAKRIRAVGDPLKRFTEDGLRSLRAVRFSAVLGFQNIDPGTYEAIQDSIPAFREVANERIREELIKILMSKHADDGIRLMIRTGLLKEIVPELGPEDATNSHRAVMHSPEDVSSRVASFLYPVQSKAVSIMRRLTFPNTTIDEVKRCLENVLPEDVGSWSDVEYRRWAAKVYPGLMQAFHTSRAIWVANSLKRADESMRMILSMIESAPPIQMKDLALNGSDIMEILKIGQSPIIGEAYRFLMNTVLDHPELNTREKLTSCLVTWYADRKDD